jgi:serine/threonine-protein kinase
VLLSGTNVAGYRIDGLLGEGSMSSVYRATQLSLNRLVALKVLGGALSQDQGLRLRFEREAQRQAGLEHDHIVTVYETGQSEHGLFLSMRLIAGPTLKQLILGGELDPRRTVCLLAQIADALDVAHEVGIIHRDVKPQNILIGPQDHGYLADFGLTKAFDEAERLTGTGQLIGTIDYLPPEQIQCEALTPASDVYALTGVVYECLTGEVPFPRPTEAATLFAHLTAPPPRVTELRPDLPSAVDEVIACGMAKAAEARPDSARKLIADVGAALGFAPDATSPTLEPPATDGDDPAACVRPQPPPELRP